VTTLAEGQLSTLVDNTLGNIEDWAAQGFMAFLLVLVVVTMVRRFSLRAGIGALLAMIIALGLWNSRHDLSDYFTDEIEENSVASAVVAPAAGEGLHHSDADGRHGSGAGGGPEGVPDGARDGGGARGGGR
jgi:hypothetical protein